jgi:hypothetical protein
MNIKRKFVIFLLLVIFLMVGVTFFVLAAKNGASISEQEAEFENIDSMLSNYERRLYSKFPDIKDWKRPEGPLKVALQVGHWKNNELPDELARLRGSSLGASARGKSEWEVNLVIAEKTAELLKTKGIEVDILPATVPISYWADLFISIHADGNTDKTVRGFKASGPRRDMTNKANEFIDILYQEYAKVTGLPTNSNITHSMSGYYAFNWFRNDHTIHPMTTGVILETGFLSNSADWNLLVNKPEIVAQGIANSIIKFLGA